jgi:hypothetical protein
MSEVKIEVFRIDEPNHPYPWRFVVIDQQGKRWTFAGIPNQCETKRAATMRARWRAKWMADGSFEKRYR